MLDLAIMERVTRRSRHERLHNTAPPCRDSPGQRFVPTVVCPSFCLFPDEGAHSPSGDCIERMKRPPTFHPTGYLRSGG